MGRKEWCPGRESYATTDTMDRCLSLIWWRECSARWRRFANAKPTYRVARGPQHPILAIGGKRCPAVGSRDVCPPKAKVTRSNRVGCASKFSDLVVFGLLSHNADPHKCSAIPRGASGKFCRRDVVVGEDQMQNLVSHEHAKSTWPTMRVRVGEIK